MTGSKRPTFCMIFEGIGPFNAIGRVAMDGIRIAQEAGYQVTVVAKRLDETLQKEVEWLKLYVPPRLLYLKWVTAERFIKQALGGRKFDIIHAHQPQAAHLSDVFQCHYLTRRAYEADCFENGNGVNKKLKRLQEYGVLRAEDRYYRRWNPKTHMLYNSGLTRDSFRQLYGAPPGEDVLVCAAPAPRIPAEDERRKARIALLGEDYKGPVVGYLGGLHRRKGYERLIKGLAGDNEVFLLMGGHRSAGFSAPEWKDRFKALGLVQDTVQFYAACDVLVVPSLYEPLGVVCFEAVAGGTPVITTGEVGALPHLLEYGMGAAWNPEEPLAPLVCDFAVRRKALEPNAIRMCLDLGTQSYKQKLLSIYQKILSEKALL